MMPCPQQRNPESAISWRLDVPIIKKLHTQAQTHGWDWTRPVDFPLGPISVAEPGSKLYFAMPVGLRFRKLK